MVPRDNDPLGVIEDGAVAVEGERIIWVGPTDELPDYHGDRARHLDASGLVVTPGLIDPHTHLIFAGSREDEFALRAQRVSYQAIAAHGGGILATVAATQASTRDELVQLGRERLDRMLAFGITTVEVKSGYGLTTEDEVKQLEVAAQLNEIHPIDVVPTFLGAHAIPGEYTTRRSAYVSLVIEEMIPAVAERDLADFCDVFCDEGAFTVDESRQILLAARDQGLIPKVHADEFAAIGAAELAAEVGAISADHLVQVTDEGIRALAERGVAAVLLPGTTLFLGKTQYAPARRLADAGIPLALATDYNPGSSMTPNLLMMLTLAVAQMGLSPEQAMVAVTRGAARALGLEGQVGSLSIGHLGDLALFDVPNYRHLPYHFGICPTRAVVKRGEVVWETGTGRGCH